MLELVVVMLIIFAWIILREAFRSKTTGKIMIGVTLVFAILTYTIFAGVGH